MEWWSRVDWRGGEGKEERSGVSGVEYGGLDQSGVGEWNGVE